MIIIFDTYAGLCNQMYDIISAIKVMKEYGVFISFRYASFRRPNLVHFYPVPFQKLFSEEPFLKEPNYIPFSSIQGDINRENTFNWEGKRCIELWRRSHKVKPNHFLSILKKIPKKYILLKQIWSLELFPFQNKELMDWIKPNKKLYQSYRNITEKLQLPNDYLFLHYRYESDFIRFFKINVLPLQDIIEEINKEKEPIYIASTKIDQLLEKKDSNIYYKEERKEFNFEENAMIDFLFGLYSKKVIGHSKSSFSHVLNDIKETKNFYA